MRVLFAYDHRFISMNGTIWTEGQFQASLWSRYLQHFDVVTVAARVRNVHKGNPTNSLAISSTLGVEFTFLPNLSSLAGLTINRKSIAKKMQVLIQEHDAVIARLPSEIGLLAISEAKAAGKPWAVEVVGCAWQSWWNFGSTLARIYAPFGWLRMRNALRCADHAIYVTDSFLQRRYPTNASNTGSASNVVLIDVHTCVLEARLSKISCNTTGLPIRLGLIGTLQTRYKGIQTVLAALGRLKNTIPPFKFLVLGSGNQTPWREEARIHGIEEQVEFVGPLRGGEEVFNWLDSIDIYLQPSLQEGLPRGLIEAMSRGCPAIASTVSGIPELLLSEDLVKPGDVTALEDLLHRRMADKNWMLNRAQRNWKVALGYRSDILQERREYFWNIFQGAARAVNLDRLSTKKK